MRQLFSLIFFVATFNANSQQLRITHLTGGLYVYTTYNLYKGSPVPSNSMYLVTDAGVLLIDVPWDTTQFQPLLDSIEHRHHKKPLMCIATHSHADRTAALEFFNKKGIQTFTSTATDSISKITGEKRAAYLFTKDTVFSIGGYRVETFYPGKGHTPDNITIWFTKDKVLYGGCFIKSTEATDLGNIADASLNEWPASLLRLQKKYPSRKYVIPGHQDWSNKNSVEHTLKLLRNK